MADEFPDEVIYQILARLPIKSLARFRCVCKSWLEYINDPYLETIYVKQPTPMMLEQYPSNSMINNEKQCRISFLRAMQGGVRLRKEPVLKFCYKGSSFGAVENMVLGSCNGLILVCYERGRDARMAIINPLSNEGHNLPPVSIPHKCYWWDAHEGASGIGIDDSINTLKTVFIILKTQSQDIDVVRKNLYVLVHDSTSGLWRKIAQVPAYPISGEGLFGDGRLHWLVSGFDWPNAGGKIVWFDVKTEEFGLTEPPKPNGGNYQLVDLNGEVGLAYINHRIELWILKKRDEWVLHCRFDLNLPQSCIDNHEISVTGCWNKDGDILLACGGAKHLFVYTLKTGDLRALDHEPCAADIRMYPSSLFLLRLKSLFATC